MKRVTLIRTAPDFPPGSMPAYANLVKKALVGMEGIELRTIDFFDPQGGGSMRRHHLWRLRHARRLFAQNPSDLYHLLDGSMAGFLPSKVWKKTIVTVHDLIPLLQMKGVLTGNPRIFGRLLIWRMLKALRHVAGVASVSSHTAKDIFNYTGRSDGTVIHNPVRPLPNCTAGILPADRRKDALELPERFIFHIGNNADYKNRSGVLDVFSRLQGLGDLHLVMAGPEPFLNLRRKAARLKRVQFLVDVSDAELSLLYKKATVFLFPSLYEGFGMPVLEAMQEGCPVVCSTAASLPEVAGDAALIAPPDDLDSLARHCAFILMDSEQREMMSQHGKERVAAFSMERFSRELKAWYLRNLNQAGDPS